MEARSGFEPEYNELQSFAYPLGHRATINKGQRSQTLKRGAILAGIPALRELCGHKHRQSGKRRRNQVAKRRRSTIN